MSTKPVSNKPVKAPQVDAAPDISKTKAPRTSTHSKDVRGKEETKAASSVVKREKPVVASKPAHKDPVKETPAEPPQRSEKVVAKPKERSEVKSKETKPKTSETSVAKKPKEKAEVPDPQPDDHYPRPTPVNVLLTSISSCSDKGSSHGKRGPPGLSQPKYGDPNPMTPDAEEDIVDSSRSFLTRLSLEEAVAVLHRLQELMMRHIATVTDSANNLPPREALPSIPEIDPFKLSKRPLEEIAEELSKQLQELVDAYEASSAADRSLMGFRDRKPTEPFVGGSEINTTFGPLVDTQSGQKTHDATFGPMFNTKVIGTTDGGAEEEKRATGQEGQSSVFGEMYSTQYTYPNGTVISFPKSTFGEMVDTKSAASVCIPRVSISRDRKAIGTQTDPLDIPAADPASTTTTQSKTGAPMDRALLDRYLKALEGRLSQKEQLDALREAKRDLRKDAGAESLNHLAFQQKLN